jgi:Fe-S cluster assembly protein SufD
MNETNFTLDAVHLLSDELKEPEWLRQFRLDAYQIYENLPMPGLSDEAWRRTDIRPLGLDSIGPLSGRNGKSRTYASQSVPKDSSGTLVQLDNSSGHTWLDETLQERGVIFTDMETAIREHSDLVQQYFMKSMVPPKAGKFAALHAAFWRGGSFLYVPAGVAVEKPFYARLWGDHGRTFSHTLVVVEPDARASLINEFHSENGDSKAFHNGVVELLLKERSSLNYVHWQDWGRNVWQINHERAIVGADANLEWVVISLGTRLTKSFQTVELDGPGASARMSGLILADGKRHLDYDTQQNHNVHDTTSDLLYKSVLKDKSRLVWQGMIKVLPGAQRTNGYQANRNLNLSKKARADSIPGLEIEADNVRCTHGATVGQVDEDEIFYLMSRGLPRQDAVRLVVGGFITPVLERIPVPEVRERLEEELDSRL